MTEEINTHHLRIEFGKHKGELWTAFRLRHRQEVVVVVEAVRLLDDLKGG